MRSVEWVGGRQVIVDRPVMSCTARQARLAMISTAYGEGTLLEAVHDAVTASGNPALAVSWEYATEWPRTAPEIAIIAAALGLTDADLNALFALAATF